MGAQRENNPPGLPIPASAAASKAEMPKREPIWRKLNHLPGLLNLAKARQETGRKKEIRPPGEVDYEPIHLHVAPSEVHPIVAAIERRNRQLGALVPETGTSQELNLDSFKFLMDQVPAVRTIEFSGRQDPFANPDLIRMVDYAYKYNGAESTIHTEGLLLADYIDNVLCSRLRTLIVNMHAHRPSIYSLMTNRPASQFVAVRDNVTALMARKRQIESPVELDIVMTVDLHNFRQIPEMIAFAQALGVDGLRFENYLPLNPDRPSDRTLYTHQKPVVQYLDALRGETRPGSRLNITWPVLLDADMSGYRNCLDPFTTVSVDTRFNVSGCSRQLLYRGEPSKLWNEDFWNNEMYQWLRSIHGSESSGPKPDVPKACWTCPRNMPCGPK